MLTNLIRQLRAFIASLIQRSSAYLENERTRLPVRRARTQTGEVSQAENNETAMLLFLLVIVWLIALACNHASRLEFGNK